MSSQQLIANEVLAYLKHAINYMDDYSILQVCRTSFEEAEMSSARLLLFQTLGRVDQMKTSCRRKITFESSLQDIITLMKETTPHALSHFVAKDLCKVPPVTCNHVDLVKILKDTTSLRDSLAELHSKLEVSNNTISDLRAEVVLLRSAVTANKSPEDNVKTQCEAQSAATSRKSSANASPMETASEALRPAASCFSTPVEVQVRVGTLPPKRAYADIAAASKSVPSQKPQAAKTKLHQAKELNPKQDTSNDDGFIKVERKKKKPVSRNQCGTAPIEDTSVLRSETPATPLYVSRLHHSTTVQDIVDYIRKQTDWKLRVEKLESRYKLNFKSFVVRVPTHCLDTFLEDDFWPAGVVYRRFRGRLRDTSQLNTTPPIPVH